MQLFDPKDQNFRTIQVTHPIALSQRRFGVHTRFRRPHRELSGKRCRNKLVTLTSRMTSADLVGERAGAGQDALEDVGSHTKR